jgi:hypothetical protein
MQAEWRFTSRSVILAALGAVTLGLAGCGLAETAGSAATNGASAAQQVEEGRKAEARVQQQLDDANRAAAQQREAAEQASQ